MTMVLEMDMKKLWRINDGKGIDYKARKRDGFK